jgi:hypothetical protein
MDVLYSDTEAHYQYTGLAERDDDEDGGQREPRKTPRNGLELDHVLHRHFYDLLSCE